MEPLTTVTLASSSFVPWPNELSPLPLARSMPALSPATFAQSVLPVVLTTRLPSLPSNVLPAKGAKRVAGMARNVRAAAVPSASQVRRRLVPVEPGIRTIRVPPDLEGLLNRRAPGGPKIRASSAARRDSRLRRSDRLLLLRISHASSNWGIVPGGFPCGANRIPAIPGWNGQSTLGITPHHKLLLSTLPWAIRAASRWVLYIDVQNERPSPQPPHPPDNTQRPFGLQKSPDAGFLCPCHEGASPNWGNGGGKRGGIVSGLAMPFLCL